MQEPPGGWAIRPSQSQVLRSVAAAAGLPIETIVGHPRSAGTNHARSVAAYLLRHDAGLSLVDTARVLQLRTTTVSKMSGRIARVLGTPDPRAKLVEGTRNLFRNGLSSGKPYPPLAVGTGMATELLPGLLACRLGARLSQRELAKRAGLARETLGRLEGLSRRAQPETVEALARALGVSVQSLTTGTVQLSVILCP